MRYYLDLEFIERGPEYPIDLISIGIVSSDGREYYAVNRECDFSKASPWVWANVLEPIGIYQSMLHRLGHELKFNGSDPSLSANTKNSIAALRTRAEIKTEILEFCNIDRYGKPEFWGEWSAYDHVVFCGIFGTMIDLPKGFPMLTFDVVQWAHHLGIPSDDLPPSLETEGNHNALLGAKTVKARYEWLAQKQLTVSR